MQDQNQTSASSIPNPPTATDSGAISAPSTKDDVIVSPDMPAPTPESAPDISDKNTGNGDIKEVADKIQAVHNILIALSSDPSVDEIAAAIGLSLCLDRAGKRATSIYSGQTPNVLEFLRPEKTFETTSDVLRDFVIALDKDKADHLRYKLDGDYVKIFITPYKSHIDEDDLEFSLGDFNIELVLALNVGSGIDLDDALREYGRVMHDATVINITNGNPGKFGDIEWSDKNKSSVCEMVAELLYELGGKNALEPNEATALLTGIVAATEHFSNNSTTADALKIGSQLMESGADRELISENIGADAQNMFFRTSSQNSEEENDSLKIDHTEDEDSANKTEETISEKPSENKPDTTSESQNSEDKELLLDLQEAADNLVKSRLDLEPQKKTAEPNTTSMNEMPTMAETTPTTDEKATSTSETIEPKLEKVISPSAEFISEETSGSNTKYGQMLEDALAEAADEPSTQTVNNELPEIPSTMTLPNIPPEQTAVLPTAPTPIDQNITMQTAPINQPTPATTTTSQINESPITPINPALSVAPSVASSPEANNIPDINYMPMPGDEILPPPPAPPIDFGQNSPSPSI